ncbi:nucleotidyl transferase AbiEii/AbiGii toxin family protein [Rhodopirellula bahusiensis]|uniref:nucleotidyl transferase AbiEii/AbiGii toxin family protein n=1 Tax=Rhodopirellula bahusiensis TaxID=2014065 RepID=UPI003263C375
MSQKPDERIEQIKRCALKGIVASDMLREQLVLKGGNAIDLVHGLGTRASMDLDFSMPADFLDVQQVSGELQRTLLKAFEGLNLLVLDFKFEPKPKKLSAAIADFWGGYKLSFKVIPEELARNLGDDLDKLRNHAMVVAPLGGKTFKVDISKFEYCEGKESSEVDGTTFYVYSIAMIVAEKFRAICQQMPEYGVVVHRTRPGAARARDFLDLHNLVSQGYVNPDSADFHEMLRETFSVKRVPLSLLSKIQSYKEFHESDFQSVIDTVHPDEELETFDYYFEFVCNLAKRLESLWDV